MLPRRARLGCLIALLSAAGPGLAQLLPSMNGSTSMIQPIAQAGGPTGGFTVDSTRALGFGRFVAATGGSVTIAPTGARSRSGGVILVNSPGTGSASFSVVQQKGGATRTVIVSVPANGTVSLSNGVATMPVGNFITGSGSLLSLGAAGLVIEVGATLTVAPNQPRGNYTGSFNLTVNYQ
jgi:hypothetical protein